MSAPIAAENVGLQTEDVVWPLESLHIKIRWGFDDRLDKNGAADSSTFCSSFFRACSTILRSLMLVLIGILGVLLTRPTTSRPFASVIKEPAISGLVFRNP